MTKTAIQILEEDMVSMGPVRLSDVIQAQEKILNIIIDLNRAYKIVIPDSRGGTPE
jgi:flagellar motor switch protein FliG